MQNIKATGDLRKVQLLQLEILCEIDKICREKKLKYYIIAGTLLGSIRHGGFIPWDSDIDIAMFRKDYEIFIKEGNKWINNKYFIQSDYSDKNHLSNFSKVRAKETIYLVKGNRTKSNHNGFYIDVFVLDDIKGKPNLFNFCLAKLLKLLQRVKAFRNGKIHSTNMSRTIIAIIISLITAIIPTEYINKFTNYIMTRDNNKGYHYVTNYSSRYGIIKQFMHKDIYGTPIELEFEGNHFYAPNNYKYWLERIYGDYLKYPNGDKITDSISDVYDYDLGPYKNLYEDSECNLLKSDKG